MSRERARRRAEREQESAAVAARQSRSERRRRFLAWVNPRGSRDPQSPQHDRRGRPDTVLGQRRRQQNAVVAMVFLAVLVVTYIAVDSWTGRLAATIIAALAVPVVVTLMFDRRP